MREAKKGLGPEAAAASGGNRRAERRKRQGALARLCRLPGSAALTFPHARSAKGKNRSGAKGDNCDSDNAAFNKLKLRTV